VISTSRPSRAAGKRPREKGLRFYIQRHDATRLHYDLRLELEGVLKQYGAGEPAGQGPGRGAREGAHALSPGR
jgi:bifunctional non-homologous end joining protein LigD